MGNGVRCFPHSIDIIADISTPLLCDEIPCYMCHALKYSRHCLPSCACHSYYHHHNFYHVMIIITLYIFFPFDGLCGHTPHHQQGAYLPCLLHLGVVLRVMLTGGRGQPDSTSLFALHCGAVVWFMPDMRPMARLHSP